MQVASLHAQGKNQLQRTRVSGPNGKGTLWGQLKGSYVTQDGHKEQSQAKSRSKLKASTHPEGQKLEGSFLFSYLKGELSGQQEEEDRNLAESEEIAPGFGLAKEAWARAHFHPSGWLGWPGWAEESLSLEGHMWCQKNCTTDQNLGFEEQNKEETVAVWGPGATTIKPEHLLRLRVNLAASAVVPGRKGRGKGLSAAGILGRHP